MLALSCWRIVTACVRRNYASSAGARSIFGMGACMLIELRAGSRVCIRYMDRSYARSGRYKEPVLTCS
jgi:hypothetical protein